MTDQETLDEQESIDPNVDAAVGNEVMVTSGRAVPIMNFFTGNLRQSGIYIAFIAIVLFFSLLKPVFLSPTNLTNIILQYSYILILAVGMALVIIGGHIDLSVGSVAALTGAVAAVVVIEKQQPWWVGVLAALAVGLLVGMWQGFWVAYVGIPSFIVTLAGMLLFRGLTFRTLDNISLSPFGGTYQKIANGFQLDVFRHPPDPKVLIGALLIIGACVAFWAYSQWRARRLQIARKAKVESTGRFVAKIVGVFLFSMWFGWMLVNGFQTGLLGKPGEGQTDWFTMIVFGAGVGWLAYSQYRHGRFKVERRSQLIKPVLETVALSAVILYVGWVLANGFHKAPFANLFGAPGEGRADMFTVFIFALGALAWAYMQWRARQARVSYNQSVEPIVLFVAKVLVIGAITVWFGYQLAKDRGLPNILIILALLVLVYGVISTRSVFGRHVYAIGGNLHAAELSGVKVKRVNFGVMVNMGLLAGLAGVAYSARTNGAQPAAGNLFELDAIAACFIGGASTTGGVGTIGGAMIGGLIMAVMSNGMQLMGIETSVQQIVKGLVLLLAVAFDIYNKRRATAAG